jgi:Family of unknown function (DUF5996)
MLSALPEDAMNKDSWPDLVWESWKDTAATLHMWTQMVGKTRLGLTPMQNHWWNVPLYVTARGLTTSAMPYGGGMLEIEFDFVAHMLELRKSDGARVERVQLELKPRSVADFYREYLAALAGLGVEVKINPMPCEVQGPVRFDLDEANKSYHRDAVERFHRVLMRSAALFARFSTGFVGKISPVHFFWGSFDLCVTRFSGRKAPVRAGMDFVQREAYSHEVISCGFWPGNGGLGYAAFYCYTAPVPAGLGERPVRPGAWNAGMGEFLLKYDDVRASASPEDEVMSFLESTYAAGADAAGWDRAALERPIAAMPVHG